MHFCTLQAASVSVPFLITAIKTPGSRQLQERVSLASQFGGGHRSSSLQREVTAAGAEFLLSLLWPPPGKKQLQDGSNYFGLQFQLNRYSRRPAGYISSKVMKQRMNSKQAVLKSLEAYPPVAYSLQGGSTFERVHNPPCATIRWPSEHVWLPGSSSHSNYNTASTHSQC